jgi:cyclopropane fatty-acyl-phospholipid synthase-like methyltransferase
MNRYEIKDRCREGLLQYSRRAIESLTLPDKPEILDLGCGTGVVALEIAEMTNGNVTAVDNDIDALEWFESKVNEMNLNERISIIRGSVFNVKIPDNGFDIIIAEGLLNVIGFETGVRSFSTWLKKGGYFIIHDELKRRENKLRIINKYKYRLINSFVLDERVWWKHYCSILEDILNSERVAIKNEKNFEQTFSVELSELALFRKKPAQFRSIYYVLKKI